MRLSADRDAAWRGVDRKAGAILIRTLLDSYFRFWGVGRVEKVGALGCDGTSRQVWIRVGLDATGQAREGEEQVTVLYFVQKMELLESDGPRKHAKSRPGYAAPRSTPRSR